MILSIIIVSYNTKEILKDCLNSVFKSFKDRKFANQTEVVVVDNHSIDGSVEFIKSFQKIKLIENKENLGFAKANNQGIKKARGEYILLLNSDTLVKKGSLENLVKFAESKVDAGVVAPRLLNQDGTIQNSCYRLPTLIRAFREFFLNQKGAFLKYTPDNDQPTVVEAVVGAAFLITPQAIKKAGLLDERYFMYFEDLDYCRRLARQGLKVYYLPQTAITHIHGASGKSLKSKPNQWLVASSKQYHGLLKYFLINLIIRLGIKYQALVRML